MDRIRQYFFDILKLFHLMINLACRLFENRPDTTETHIHSPRTQGAWYFNGCVGRPIQLFLFTQYLFSVFCFRAIDLLIFIFIIIILEIILLR